MLILCDAYFVLNFFQCFILTLELPFNCIVQLTYESATNNSLLFLDYLIERVSNYPEVVLDLSPLVANPP